MSSTTSSPIPTSGSPTFQSLPIAVNHAEQWSHLNNTSSPTLRSPVSKLSRMWSTMNDVPFAGKITSPTTATCSGNQTTTTRGKMTEQTLQNQHLQSQGFRLLSAVMTNEYQDNPSKRLEFDVLAIKTMERELANERPLLIHCHRQYVMLVLGYNRNEQMFSGYLTSFLIEQNFYDDILTYSDHLLSYADATRAFNIVLTSTPTSPAGSVTAPVFVYGFDKLDRSLLLDASINTNKKELQDSDVTTIKIFSPILKANRELPNSTSSYPTSPIALQLPKSVTTMTAFDMSLAAGAHPQSSGLAQQQPQSVAEAHAQSQSQFQFPLLNLLPRIQNVPNSDKTTEHDVDNASPKTIVIELPDSNELGTIVRSGQPTAVEQTFDLLPTTQSIADRQNSAFGNSASHNHSTTITNVLSTKPIPVIVPMPPVVHHVVQHHVPVGSPQQQQQHRPGSPPARRSPAPVRRSPGPVRRSPGPMRRAPATASPRRRPPAAASPRRVRASPRRRAPAPAAARRRPAARLVRRTSAVLKKIFGRASPRRR